VRVLGDADLLDLLHRAATGRLDDVEDVRANGAAVAVCVAAEHYPELQLEPAPVLVTGLEAAARVPGVELFIGLASRSPSGSGDELLALGGRYASLVARDADVGDVVPTPS
jgi:phosphoribosylamine-glycine ligase